MHPDTYKAAIFRGPGQVDVIDLPYPPCGEDEAIVRNVLTGICGSDIFAWQNHGPTSRIWVDEEFGHESISEVVELGCNVRGLKVGDRVFVNTDKAFRDKRRVSAAGGFSTYLRIPQCEVGYSLLPIDAELPLRAAVLFEPFVIGTRGVRELNVQPGECAVVFGAGIIGMTSAIMLKWYGCAEVMLVDLSEFRLANARKLGFLTCNPAHEDLRNAAFAAFGRSPGYPAEKCGARLYVDAVGVPSVIESFRRARAAQRQPGAGGGAQTACAARSHPDRLQQLAHPRLRRRRDRGDAARHPGDDAFGPVRSCQPGDT